MVDLIPKEARKTGEGKGSVLVKKGCEIVRWFVSSYSCFFLSFPTSLTVPSQLLFFRPVEVVRPIFPCGKPTPTLPEFRDFGAFRKPLPAYPPLLSLRSQSPQPLPPAGFRIAKH